MSDRLSEAPETAEEAGVIAALECAKAQPQWTSREEVENGMDAIIMAALSAALEVERRKLRAVVDCGVLDAPCSTDADCGRPCQSHLVDLCAKLEDRLRAVVQAVPHDFDADWAPECPPDCRRCRCEKLAGGEE